MKKRLPLWLGCFCLLSACSDSSDDKSPVSLECDNSYIIVCNEARTGYTVCRVGVITNVDCGAGQVCNPNTSACETPGTPSECDANTKPVCNGASSRKICQNGKLVDDPCKSGTECNAATGICEDVTGPSDKCSATDTPVCNGKNARKICQNGDWVDETCPDKTECQDATGTCEAVAGPSDKCSASDTPVCNGKNARKICQNGDWIDETCPDKTECQEATGKCEASVTPPSNTCDASYVETCSDARHHTYCKDGQIMTEECKAGKICNAALNTKQCKTAAVNDKCDPETFSESCYDDDAALICDEGKVVRFNCSDKENYGKGYKCDVVADYYGKSLDATLCYSRAEDCRTPGESFSQCAFDTDEDGYDYHYQLTFVCVEGVVGKHYYLAEEKECEHSCNKDKTACSE